MPLARAPGHPNHSSTGGTSRFAPQVWAGKLVEKFYDATVFGEIANTDYEGDIMDMGDSVVINTTPTLAINDYSVGQTLAYEDPTSDSVTLNIDKGKYFAFKVEDIDEYQANINLMDDWAEDGGNQMRISIDRDMLAGIPADIDAENAGATAGRLSQDIDLGATGAPFVLTKANIIDKIVDLGTVLDEQNVPEVGRWLVLPAWACGMIKKSDLKDASIAGDGTSIARNGRIGMIDRFTIYLSNNVSITDDGGTNVSNIIAGHKAGLTFAAQFTKMETLPNPNQFGQLIRGLNVYGYEVIEGKYLAHLYATKG